MLAARPHKVGEPMRLVADVAAAGTFDLSICEHRRLALKNINAALAGIPHRNGGFANFVTVP